MKTLWDKLEKKEVICATVLVAYFCFLLIWPLVFLTGFDGFSLVADAFLMWCAEDLSLGTMWIIAALVATFGENTIAALILIGIYFAIVLLMIFGTLFSFKKPRAIWIVYIICAVDILLGLLIPRMTTSRVFVVLFDIGVIILAGMIDRRKALSFIPKEKVQDL